jgi:hypothetical protein
MIALALEVVGAGCVIAGFALLAPFAGFLAAGVLLIAFGVAMSREGE